MKRRRSTLCTRRLAPDEDDDAAPVWLRPEQARSFRRALHALRCYGGALLADPVGSGKTYVALAVALVLDPHRPVVCLAPATLVAQSDVVVVSHATAEFRATVARRPQDVHVLDLARLFRTPPRAPTYQGIAW